MTLKNDGELGNAFVRVIGLLGFILATVAFLLILSGVKDAENAANSSGIVLFTSFIMCAGLAFAGLMITTLAQISDTLRSIENLLKGQQVTKE
ncbi:MAG: hypothetical protein KJ667_04590 [Alphaproteobacteria bacterium]|nr:hypothetical protein [Alphaproteobacteria bacterium]